MSMMKEVAIHFRDLTKEKQKEILEEFQTTEEDENWEITALAVIGREENPKEEKL